MEPATAHTGRRENRRRPGGGLAGKEVSKMKARKEPGDFWRTSSGYGAVDNNFKKHFFEGTGAEQQARAWASGTATKLHYHPYSSKKDVRIYSSGPQIDLSSSSQNINFQKVSAESLQRYVEHYQLPVAHNIEKQHMAEQVARHFAWHTVQDEEEILSRFMNALYSPGMDANHERNSPNKRPGKATTYGEMIAASLGKLPQQEGTLEDICRMIDHQFSEHLNKELESGPRKIPVWKASVRKIINLNYGMRFKRTGMDPNGKAIYGFSDNSKLDSSETAFLKRSAA